MRWLLHPHHTLLHCTRHDSLLAAVIGALCVAVVVGYVVIAARWLRAARLASEEEGARALRLLVWIFLWCGSTYLYRAVSIVYSPYRVLALQLGVLAVLTWIYVLRVRPSTIGRMFREVAAAPQLRAELEAAEIPLQQYAAIFDRGPLATAIVPPDSKITRANVAAERFFGRTEEELRETRWQDITHPDDLAADLDLYNEVVAGKRESYELRKRYLHASGCTIWGDLYVSAIRNEDGSLRHCVVSVVDVTKIVAAERLQSATIKSLQAQRAAAERLTSHERAQTVQAIDRLLAKYEVSGG